METMSSIPPDPAVLVTLNTEHAYAIITLQREPVNSLDLVTYTALLKALDSLEADPSMRGVIIQSGLKRDVFCAGNDLLELYAPATTAARYRDFWVTSNTFLARLHQSRLATIATIQGACPAAGCVLAMCCEHRLMTSAAAGAIGLNEVAVGIPVPLIWCTLMRSVIGNRAAERLLLTGRMLTSREALEVGLVDQVMESSQLLPAARELMTKLTSLPNLARSSTKLNLRSDFAPAGQSWESYFAAEVPLGWDLLTQPATLQSLSGTLKRLRKGASKPGQEQGLAKL